MSPDYKEGSTFPINAAQLYYLIKHNFVDYPDMKAMAISERNSVDALSRYDEETSLVLLWHF